MIRLKIDKIVMITHHSVHGGRQKSKGNGKPLTTPGMDIGSPYWDAHQKDLHSRESSNERITM
jgi:hypothetical protein